MKTKGQNEPEILVHQEINSFAPIFYTVSLDTHKINSNV